MVKASMVALCAVVGLLLLFSTTTAAEEYFRLLGPDLRCGLSDCGGHVLERTNVRGSFEYVGYIDYTRASPYVPATVEKFMKTVGSNSSALTAQGLVMFYGSIVRGTRRRQHSRRFDMDKLEVTTVYLGLPGQSTGQRRGYAYYTLSSSFGRPRKTVAQKLNAPAAPIAIRRRSVRPVQPTAYLDLLWQLNQIHHKGAIVLGRIATRGLRTVIRIKAVFIALPVQGGPCPRLAIRCLRRGFIVSIRTVNLCFRSACVYKKSVCPRFMPRCPNGYQLAGWSAPPGGCTQYACDPIFMPRATELPF